MACACKKCSFCNGSGDVWRSLSGKICGSHWDDLDSLEPCPYCDGSGYEEICAECMEKEFEDYENDFMEWWVEC